MMISSLAKPTDLVKHQQIYSSMQIGLARLNRVRLVMDRAGWTLQVIYLVNLQINRKCYVVSYELETRITNQMPCIIFGSGEQITQTNNITPIPQQSFKKVRTKESCTPGDQN